MKPFSANRKPVSRAKARNAALLNQLATPGLGSILCGRWIAGGGQLLLAVAGFILVAVWFFEEVIPYYGMMFGDQPRLPGFKMLAVGGDLFAVAWLWSAVTSFSLLREAAADKQRALKNFAAPPVQKLAEAKTIPALASIPDWKLQDATISRTFQFKDFPAAIQFVGAVAGIAEQAWHHPYIDIRWNKVTLTLTTHDAGGLTEKDFALARQFDKL